MSDESVETIKRSSRDLGELAGRLRDWLAGRLPEGAEPGISELASPSASGMSSETLLFDASWSEAGQRRSGAFVARLRPDPEDVPIFPVYDLDAQFRVMRLVGECSDVPVPLGRWLELDERHLGTPFLVMDRVSGRVPPDVMPYPMGSWLSDAKPADQRKLQDATVATLASLHAIDVGAVDASFLDLDVPGKTPLRRHLESQRRYYAWVRGERHFPVLERAFEWLEAHWPDDEGETVISWGDSRIGNVLYDGFEPVAVLDWEMAGLAPRELDLGWLIFMHRFFQDISVQLGHPGMPDFLRREDVAATYQARAGVAPRHLPFYEVYAALRHGIVMARIQARRVHFGEAEWPDDADEAIPHRAALGRMLEAGDWD
jgi:aminoglycoside phosphotransferase (APT) family kinase protein